VSDDAAQRLRAAIVRATEGASDGADVVPLFLEATLVIPSGAPVGQRFDGFQPVLYDRDGTPMLAVFTHVERIGSVGRLAPYAVSMTGAQLVVRMPPETGLVVDPGHRHGFELPPHGVASLSAELARGEA